MKKFKVGQIIYYFKTEPGSVIGEIYEGEVTHVLKDLTTKEVTYVVYDFVLDDILPVGARTELSAERMYESREKAVEAHKAELAYCELASRLRRLEENVRSLLLPVCEEALRRPVSNDLSSYTSASPEEESLRGVKAELDALKAELDDVKRVLDERAKRNKKAAKTKKPADKADKEESR